MATVSEWELALVRVWGPAMARESESEPAWAWASESELAWG